MPQVLHDLHWRWLLFPDCAHYRSGYNPRQTCPVCCVVRSQRECGSFCTGWVYGQMLGYLGSENWFWLRGRGGLVPEGRMVRALRRQCHRRRSRGRAAQSSALRVGERNAGKTGRWDCWGVPISLYVDGGHWGGRLHLDNNKPWIWMSHRSHIQNHLFLKYIS